MLEEGVTGGEIGGEFFLFGAAFWGGCMPLLPCPSTSSRKLFGERTKRALCFHTQRVLSRKVLGPNLYGRETRHT